MSENDWLVEQFEEHRTHLRGVAYRMLGSLTEADDAVQETWQRVSRSDTSDVENLGGWLTTITSRVCLNVLRSRRTRREEPLEAYVPDPIVERPDASDPDRSPEATRQLASRARRRVQGGASDHAADRARQREVVDAFFAAARSGDFDRLVELLDPDIVLRADAGPDARVVVRGAAAVARRALMFARPSATLHPVLVNGDVAVVATIDGRPFGVMAFAVSEGRIVAIDSLADPNRLDQLDLRVLDG